MRLNRAQIIVLVLLGLVVILGVVLSRLIRPGASPTVTPFTTVSEIGSPAYNPADRSLYFFDRQEERLAKLDSSGSVTHLSDRLPTIDRVLWSPDFTKALLRNVNDVNIESPLVRPDQEDGLILTWLFSLADQKLTFVSADYGDVLWAGSDQILYYFAGDDPGDLSLAKPDGSDFQLLARISDQLLSRLVAYVPNQRVIFRGGIDEEEDNLFFFDLTSQQSTKIAEQATTQMAGNTLFYVSLTEPGQLVRYDLAQRTPEPIFSSQEDIIAFAPGGENLTVSTKQRVLLINLSSGRQTVIKLEETLIPVTFFLPTSDSKQFFFTSHNTLYRLELP